MLNEKQVWCNLRNYFLVNKVTGNGLCHVLNMQDCSNQIRWKVQARIREDVKKSNYEPYLYEKHKEKGSKQRVQYCTRQIERLDELTAWKKVLKLLKTDYKKKSHYNIICICDKLLYIFGNANNNKIDRKMRKKIELAVSKSIHTPFIADFNTKGLETRIKFCEKQIKKLS
jgi:hypothetical protein